MPHFSQRSINRLNTCDSRLRDILMEVIKYYDCTILFGHRTKVEQNALFNTTPQRSKKQWPNSKHNSNPSLAVDVAPWPIPEDWGEKWKDRVKFYELKAIIFFVAEKQGTKIRFGGDWDMDEDYKDQRFDDLVHFEVLD